MKKLCETISSNGRQILEIVALIIVTSIPWVVDLQEIFKEYLTNQPISPDDFFWQAALRMGKPVASVILFFAVLIVIRKFNRNIIPHFRKHLPFSMNFSHYSIFVFNFPTNQNISFFYVGTRRN